MDPNANLQEQERIVLLAERRPLDRVQFRESRAAQARLKELRWALSRWLANNGFEPDWSLAPVARAYYKR